MSWVASSATGVCDSILDAVGCTPLVALDRLTDGLDGRIFAKLEYLNPTHSKKDRVAINILRSALESEQLRPGQTVVELTSGSMGTSLAMACTILGHPFIAVMSKGNSAERAMMMHALGAEVVLVDQQDDGASGCVSGADLELVEQAARQITKEKQAFRIDQFVRLENRNAHLQITAPEIWDQTGGRFTAFCDFVGSGGSYAGCTLYFKALRSKINCYIVEPDGAAVLGGIPVTKEPHPIQGGGYARDILPNLNDVPVDGFLTVTGDAAIVCTKRLAAEEGIFAGVSAGANVAAALALLDGPEKGGTIVVLICDSGLKYTSTGIWS